MSFCPNIHSKEWKSHDKIFPETGYILWHRNGGNELSLAQNGNVSNLFLELSKILGNDVDALKLKGEVLLNSSFLEKYGNWTNGNGDIYLDDNGEPKIVYKANIIHNDKYLYTTDSSLALNPNEPGILINKNDVSNVKLNGNDYINLVNDSNFKNILHNNKVNFQFNGKTISVNKKINSTEKFNEAKKWLNGKFGKSIDLNIVSGLIENGLFGITLNSAIYLDENADVNTLYHEAFHIVFNNVLSESERISFINKVITLDRYKNEFNRLKSLDSFKDYSDSKIAEELLAEEFSEFMVDENLHKSNKLVFSIFKKIKNYITNFFRKLFNLEESPEELFDRISSSSFKNIKIDSEIKAARPFDIKDEFKKKISETNKDKYTSGYFKIDTIDLMLHSFKKYLLQDNNTLASSLTSLKDSMKLNEIFQFINNDITKRYNDEIDFETKENFNFILNHFEQAQSFLMEFLINNVNFNELNNYDAVNDFINEEDHGNDTTWELASKSLQIDPKTSTPSLIRLVLSLMDSHVEDTTKTDDELEIDRENNAHNKNASFGNYRLVKFNEVYSQLSYIFSGCKTKNDFISKLNILSIHNAELYRFVNDNIFSIDLTNNNNINLYLKFTQTFSKQTNSFGIIFIDKDGRLSVMNTSLDDVRKNLVAQWTSNETELNSKHKNFIVDGKYSSGMKKLIIETGNNLVNQGVLHYSKWHDSKSMSTKRNVHSQIMSIKAFTDILGININYKSLEFLLTNPNNSNEINADYIVFKNKLHNLIYKILEKDAGTVTNLFSKTENADENSLITLAAKIESTYNVNSFNNSHYNIEGNLVFNNSNYTFLSHAVKDINDLNDMIKSGNVPFHLDVTKNPFIKNSIVLNSKTTDSLKISINEGMVMQQADSIPYYKLSDTSKLLMSFINHFSGNYEIIQGGSNTISRWIHIDGSLNRREAKDGIFFGYLLDELMSKAYYNNFISETNNKTNIYNNINSSSADIHKVGPMMDLLKDVASDVYNDLINILKENKNNVEKELNDYALKNHEVITNAIKEFIHNESEKLLELFIKEKLIKHINDNTLEFKILNSNNDMERISGRQGRQFMLGVMNEFLSSSMIANTEQYKMFFGNPIAYQNLDSIFKRISSALGPKGMQNTHTEVNQFINEKLKRVDGKISELDNPTVNSLTIADVLTIHDLGFTEENLKEFDEESRKELYNIQDSFHGNMEESDGASWITLDSGREFLFRDSSWEIEGNSAQENLYQHEMQRYVGYLIANGIEDLSMFEDRFGYSPASSPEEFAEWIKDGNYKPINPLTGKSIVKIETKLNSLKPLHYGPYADNSGLYGIFKTSFIWITPSLCIDFNNNTLLRSNMFKMLELMRKSKLDVVSSYSANKGITTKLLSDDKWFEANNSKQVFQDKYNLPSSYNVETLEDGTEIAGIGLTPMNISDSIQKTYYNYWGIQVPTGFGEHNTSPFASQAAKQVISNIYDDGSSEFSELQRLAEEYKSANKERILNNFELLKNKLGIVERDGKLIIPSESKNKLIELLRESSIRSKAAENIIDSYNNLLDPVFDEIGFDILVNSRQAIQTLMSIADKMTLSKSVNGKQSAQVPSTFFELDGTTRKYVKTKTKSGEKEYITSDQLFYTINNGVVSSMEVYLPSYLKGIVNIDSDLSHLSEEHKSSILEILGIRIPTSSIGLIESMKVKGFLPASFGDIIVLPTAIVKKAGSDYDIDKMYLYIKNVFKDANGKIRLIDYSSDEVTLRKNYEDYHVDMRKNVIGKIVNSLLGNSFNIDTDGEVDKKFNINLASFLDDMLSDQFLDKANKLTKDELDNLLFSSILQYINKSNISYSKINKINDLVYKLTELVYNDELSNIINEMDFETFKGKAIENHMFSLMNKLVTHKDNAKNLLHPLDGEIVNGLIELMKKYNKNSDEKSLINAIHPLYIKSVTNRAMAGASAVGPCALSSAFHIIAQESGLELIHTFINSIKNNINLNSNSSANAIKLGKTYDSKLINKISTVLEELISASVDNPKDPKLGKIGINDDVLNIALYLTISGVNIEDVILFVNQPIIKDFIANKKTYNSELIELLDSKKSEMSVIKDVLFLDIDKLKSAFKSDKLITNEDLKANFSLNNKDFNILLIAEFLKHKESANKLKELILNIQYDTKSFEGGIIESKVRSKKVERLLKDNIFRNLDVMLNGKNSFIQPYKEVFDDTIESFQKIISPLFSSENDFGIYFDKLLTLYATELKGQKKEDIINALYKYRKGFLDFFVNYNGGMEKSRELQSKIFNSKDDVLSINNISEIKNILEKGDVPNAKLTRAERRIYNMYKNSALFKQITIVNDINNKYGYSGLKFRNRKMEAADSEAVTQELEKFMSTNYPMFISFLRLQLMQFGMGSGVNGYLHLFPYKKTSYTLNSLMRKTIKEFSSNTDMLEAIRIYINIVNYNDNIMTTTKNITRKSVQKKLTPILKTYSLKPNSQTLKLAKINPFHSVPSMSIMINESDTLHIVSPTDLGMEFKDGKNIGNNIMRDSRNGMELNLYDSSDILEKIQKALNSDDGFLRIANTKEEALTEEALKEQAMNVKINDVIKVLESNNQLQDVYDRLGIENTSSIDNNVSTGRLNQNTNMVKTSEGIEINSYQTGLGNDLTNVHYANKEFNTLILKELENSNSIEEAANNIYDKLC